jgi:colanic acid biosynthesis glycosyl transferase WcaI
VPDPAAVGQHIADVAFEMARRGHRVRVYTANRGYEDTSARYPARENIRGVEVRRLPLSSFGKKSILTRLIGTFSFMIQCIFLGLFLRRVDAIFFSTSPPLIGIAASIARLIRRVPIAYWAMDLNPDQLIAMRKIRPRGPVALVLELVNRIILWNCSLVVALDRFMAGRLLARADLGGRLLVLPPWSHEDVMEQVPHEQNPFRHRHALDGRFIIMYSGNHSPANPLDTLLQAAVRFRDDPDIRFLFVGGGIGKKAVESFIRDKGLANAICLPYQPLAELRHSLPAADVHVVSLGQEMVGIIHPCKIYGAMAIARPILYIGPRPSHITDLLDDRPFGEQVMHGDVDGAVAAIGRLRSAGRDQLERMGRTGQEALREALGQSVMCGRLCDRLEQVLGARPRGRRQAPTDEPVTIDT